MDQSVLEPAYIYIYMYEKIAFEDFNVELLLCYNFMILNLERMFLKATIVVNLAFCSSGHQQELFVVAYSSHLLRV